MPIGKVGARFAMATDAGKMVAGVMMLIHWFLSWFVMSVVVLFRKNHGERYLGVTNLLFGLTAVSFFTGLGNLIFSQGAEHMSWAIELSYYVVAVASIYHRVVIYRRNKRGELWHSLFPGTSLIKLPWISEETVAKWVEPALLFVGAFIAAKMGDNPLKLWLLISGFALLVHEQIAYFIQRNQFLDLRDAMIESKNWSAVMKGKPAEETQGYTIAKSNLEILGNGNGEEFSPETMKWILDKELA